MDATGKSPAGVATVALVWIYLGCFNFSSGFFAFGIELGPVASAYFPLVCLLDPVLYACA